LDHLLKLITSNTDSKLRKKFHFFNIFSLESNLKNHNLTIVSKKGWHKIPNIFFMKCRNPKMLKFLLYLENFVKIILPFFIFSRGIVIKTKKTEPRQDWDIPIELLWYQALKSDEARLQQNHAFSSL